MASVPAGPLSVEMVTTSYPRWPGDHAGHFVESLATSLIAEGNSVGVIAPHDSGAALSEVVSGVNVTRVRYMRDSMERTAYGSGIMPNLKRDPRALVGVPALRRAMSRAVRKAAADVDIIHVHWAPTVMLAGLSRIETPVVLTLHGTDATMAANSKPWRQVLTRALRSADGVTTVSEQQAELLREWGMWDGPLQVIPAGVPSELFDLPRQAVSDQAPFTFVFVGRLIEEKGLVDLVEAFTRLDRRCAGGCRLMIVGAGPLEAKMRERVVARRLMGEVTFLGHLPQPETIKVVAAADALVLPSYGEGSPLSVVEAMAVGTPVIGTRVGAIESIVAEDGCCVDVGDIAALTEAMESWVNDPSAARLAGQRGRARLADTHAWPRLAVRTEEFYRETLAAATRGSRAPEVDL